MRANGSLLAVVGKAVILSVGTPQPNPPGGVRVGEAVFASVWTPQLIPPGGLMAPDAVLPLYRLHIHTCDSSQIQLAPSCSNWSHVCICWVLWRFRQRRRSASLCVKPYGCGPLQASLGRLLTSKGCKGMIEYIKTTYVQPITTQGEPVTAVGYGFTDLRIYPPPSPSAGGTRRRAPTNQNVAGT